MNRALLALALAMLHLPAVPARPLVGAGKGEAASSLLALRARPPREEVIYFLLPDRFDNGDPRNDRGGLAGDRLATGYDPTDKGFYHGGDLAGLTRRLDYIAGLGATAVWVGPIFRNKPVQGAPGHESAGYHGYWITDFESVDPHLGTAADFTRLVATAHARGLKVYMDIVANHTADVIRYRECVWQQPCPYRSVADYPWARRGGVGGPAINAGFAGLDDQSPANFARATDPTAAYAPYVPAAERDAKSPAWLNDLTLYHNRGDTDWKGESSRLGDFAGLDDLMTENPRVLAGMIAVFGGWIDRFGVDGFRIDTARHVNPEFWAAFVPAMRERAAARGIPNFAVFGEVFDPDPGVLAQYTRRDRLPAVLDFAFEETVEAMLTGKTGPDAYTRLIAADVLYADGADANPTFTGNHDMGRLTAKLDAAFPTASDAERLARLELAHALMLTSRGVPTVYAGDEQGFTGGGDQDGREDMFGTRTAQYAAERLVGTAATPATPRFDPGHPLYRAVARLARLRRYSPALTGGRYPGAGGRGQARPAGLHPRDRGGDRTRACQQLGRTGARQRRHPRRCHQPDRALGRVPCPP